MHLNELKGTNAADVIRFLIRSLLFIEILSNINSKKCVFPPASISGNLYSMISGKLVTYTLVKNWQLNWQEFDSEWIISKS